MFANLPELFSDYFSSPPYSLTVTAEGCARQTLNDLAQSGQWETEGHWNHKLQFRLFKPVPESLYVKIFKGAIAPQFFKEREEGSKARAQQSTQAEKKAN